MDEHLQKQIDELKALVAENTEIVRDIRRGQRRALWFRVAYWFVVLGLAFGSFYFIEPYLTYLTGMANDSQSTLESLKSYIPDATKVQDLIEITQPQKK